MLQRDSAETLRRVNQDWPPYEFVTCVGAYFTADGFGKARAVAFDLL